MYRSSVLSNVLYLSSCSYEIRGDGGAPEATRSDLGSFDRREQQHHCEFALCRTFAITIARWIQVHASRCPKASFMQVRQHIFVPHET